MTISYQGQFFSAFTVPVAPSAPSLFSLNGSGAGQAAAVNSDGSLNDATHPVKIGNYISLYATGEGQTSPAGVDGKLASALPYPSPVLTVKATVDGLPATVVYAGAAPTWSPVSCRSMCKFPVGRAARQYAHPVERNHGA